MASSSGADIYVSFGADTGGLEAALALAKQNVTALTRELNAAAKEMKNTAAAADSELGVKVKSLGSDLAGSKAQMTGISKELKALTDGIEETGHAGAHGGAGLGFYVRELHAVMDEIGSGRTRQAIGTVSNLVMTFLQANLSMIPLAAGAAVVAAAFAYIAYQAHAAAQGVRSIELDAVVAQFRLTDDQARQLMTSIAGLANVSNATAAEIAKPFLALGPGGDLVAKLTSGFLPLLANQMGETVPKAAEKLAENFADLSTKGRAYITETRGMTSAQIAQYDSFVASGQIGQAYAMIVDAMRVRIGIYAEEVKRKDAAERDATAAMLETSHAYAGMEGVIVDLGGHLDEVNTKLREQASAAKADEEALLGTVHAQQAFAEGLATAVKVDKLAGEIKTTTAEIEKMQAALRNVPANDSDATSTLSRSLSIAQDHLNELQQKAGDGLLGRDALTRTKESLTEFSNTFKGSTVERLEGERSMLASLLSAQNLTAQQRHQIEADLGAKDREIRDAANRAFEAQEDIKAAAAGLTKAKVVAIREEEVAHEIAVYGEGSEQALAAERKLATAKEQLAKKDSALATTSAKDQLNATVESIRGQIEQIERATRLQLDHFAAEVKLKQITEEQKTAYAIAALNQEKAAITDLYGRELALAGLTASKRQEITNQQMAFNDKNATELYDAQKEAALKSEQAWDSAMKTINSAFDSQVNGLLTGTTNWNTAMKNVLRSLTEDVIKFFLNWGLQEAENTAKSIFLNHSVVASHVAGATAMAAADQSASAAGLGSMIANALHAITVDAGQAAAGVTAFLAPILGPAALPAGEAVGSSVIALGSVYDSGTFSVPHDMVAGIHKGEMIIPQRGGVADEFRSFMAGGGFSGGGQGGGRAVSINPSTHFHVSALDAGSVSQWMKSNSSTMMKSIDEAVRHGAHLGTRRLSSL